MKLRIHLFFGLFVLNGLLTTPLLSAQFAYIPVSVENGFIFVVNTTTRRIVDEIPVGPNPISVAIHPDATRLYVTERSGKEDVSGTVGIINALRNRKFDTVHDVGIDPSGLALNQQGTALYVTHRQGIAVIDVDEMSDLAFTVVGQIEDITYRGNAVALSANQEYLLVTGSNEAGVYGISAIDLQNMQEISLMELDEGAMGIAVHPDIEVPFVYIANQIADTVTALRFEGASRASTEFSVEHNYLLPIKSGPYDLAITNDGRYLYVSNSGQANLHSESKDDAKNGNIAKIDLRSASTKINYLALDPATFNKNPSHPFGIAFDNSGELFITQNIWAQDGGLFFTTIEDKTTFDLAERSRGLRLIGSDTKTGPDAEANTNNLPGGGNSFVFGNFIGPDCEACDLGVVPEVTPPIVRQVRPAALSLFNLIFLSALLLLFRRKVRTLLPPLFCNETHYS